MDKSQVLRTVADIDLQGKSILMRIDLDVPTKDGKISDDSRLLMTLETVEAVMAAKPKKVTIIGHLGRPEQRTENTRLPARQGEQRTENRKQRAKWSMEPVRKWYRERLSGYENWEVWENLRFDIGEETNSQSFAEDIVRRSSADVYVFEAFATAHEPHASVISVPKLAAQTVVGFRFAEEIRNLSKIWQNPKRPVVFVLGGAKIDTKIGLIPKLVEQADEVLVGGLLPTKLGSVCLPGGKCLTVARLNQAGDDILPEEADRFGKIISEAGTVVWNGPMGAFEKSSHKSEIINHKSESQYINTPTYGTYIVAKAMRETKAFTVAGGGDTEAALTKLGGSEGIDWISSGGGAMLYFLAHRTLPFLEVIK